MDEVNLVSTEALQERLEVSRSTVWRLRRKGMPFRRVGRSVRFSLPEVEAWLEQEEPAGVTGAARIANPVATPGPVQQPLLPTILDGPDSLRGQGSASPAPLPPCHWSPEVALDPKHRPQTIHGPSTTVRKDWRKYPQEAHLLDPEGHRFRRLTEDEIATLQGFPSDWGSAVGLTHRERIAGLGNAVPPPLGEALHRALSEVLGTPRLTAVELCAGFGGMALGAHRAGRFEMLAMVEFWDAAVRVLRSAGVWPAELVHHLDVRDFNWVEFAGKVDVLSGGPPCQPWSRAGHSKGAEDERDLLGEMPGVVRSLSPRAFVFENVPGLIAPTHKPYLEWLIGELRGCGYGVAVGVVQAADFGVPQKRRRVIVVGLQGMADRAAHEFFDRLARFRTHADPSKALPLGRLPWETLGRALPHWSSEPGWRRWIDLPRARDEMSGPDSEHGIEPANGHGSASGSRRPAIGLVWPGRDRRVRWTDGRWTVTDEPDRLNGRCRPLQGSLESGRPLLDPWYVRGDHIESLEAIRPSLGRRSTLVYFEPPRLDTDLASFAAEESRERLNTWLALNQATIRRAVSLVRDDGVVVVLAGSAEQPYLQVLMDEMFGPDNRVGTVVWQKGYSVQGQKKDKPKKDVYPTHDYLLIYSRRREECLPGAALKGPPKKFANPDEDPRGPWKAEQKGANYRRDSSDFSVKLPPYRWEVIGGDLPPWFWRISPKSGVIWVPADRLTTPGSWSIRVKVTDSKGATAECDYEVHVRADGAPPSPLAPSWLVVRDGDGRPVDVDEPANGPKAGGRVRITTAELPEGVVGQPYYACIEADGGDPYPGTTRPGKSSEGGKGRYWDLSYSTLERAAAEDAVDFKSRDDSIPAAKVFLDGASFTYLNQISTWRGEGRGKVNGAKDPARPGWGQDAKKELEELHRSGLIEKVVNIGKPTGLVSRLLGMFTQENDHVVDIGSATAELASVACQIGRRAVYVELPGTDENAGPIRIPRLAAAARGVHPVPEGVLFFGTASEPNPNGFYVGHGPRQEDESGDACIFELGAPFVGVDEATKTPQIDYSAYPSDSVEFEKALASVEGLVWCPGDGPEFARSLDGNVVALHFDGRTVLDRRKVEQLMESYAEHLGSHTNRIRIYYHRGYGESGSYDRQVELRHVPFGLTAAGGGWL